MVNLKTVFKFNEVETAENGAMIRAVWSVPHDLPFFEGHFPGQPIVPAVSIIDASIELIRQNSSPELKQLSLRGVKTSKFLNPLEPGVDVEIECRLIGDPAQSDEWAVDIKNLSKAFARLSLVLGGRI